MRFGEQMQALERRVAALEAAPPALPAPPGLATTLARIAAEEFGVPLAEVLSPSRAARVVRPRQVVMHLLLRRAGWSLKRVGRVLRRDHATVMHGDRKVAALATTNPELQARIERIAARAAAEGGIAWRG